MVDQSLCSPTKPHFFKPLLPDFHIHLNILVTFFSKHVQGRSDHINTAKLITDASDKMWTVKMDGSKFTDGWGEFAAAHALRVGDIIVFRHEGEMVFHVTPMRPSCCEIQYTHSHIAKEEAKTDDDENGNHQGGNGVEPTPMAASSITFDYLFVARVTSSNINQDRIYLPVSATSCIVLNKQCRKMILVNKDGNSWNVGLRFSESHGGYYIINGWRRFCLDNGQRDGDSIVFNIVGDGTTTPLMCVCPEEEED